MPRRFGHCKLCELADFADPELRELIRDVYAADREHFGEPDFPTGREYRKYWEVAMTLRALGALGALREDARVLGVGAAMRRRSTGSRGRSGESWPPIATRWRTTGPALVTPVRTC